MAIPCDFSSSLLNFSQSERQALEVGNLLIHRIFPFDRFVDVLRESRITLVKPKLWDDPYENLMSRELIESETGRKLLLPTYRNDVFGQCWSLTPESDAMWRIYSGDKRGVMVSADAKIIFDTKKMSFGHPMELLFLGKVEYMSVTELKTKFESVDFIQEAVASSMYSSASARTLLYKRDSFRHENEVRWIAHRNVSDVPGDLLAIDFDARAAIRSVTLDPRLAPEDVDRTQYLLKSVGYAGPVAKSTLYDAPNLNLAIPSVERVHKRQS